MSETKVAFARRLNEAFDRLGVPPKQHGRFTALARLFGVSAVAARDWCEGKSYPNVDKLLAIMDTVRCGADWLLFGRTPEAAATAGQRPPQVADTGVSLDVVGDAMAPTLQPGDSVELAPLTPDGLRDGIYALRPERQPAAPQLRRLQLRLDGSVACSCDNPLYGERYELARGEAGQLQALRAGDPDMVLLGRVCAVRRALP
ncbi:MAG: hypothetical protein KGI67_06275 [Pseudomonadota bacterium]|nr:hypothetical protein [Pseudomonadota bacterium]